MRRSTYARSNRATARRRATENGASTSSSVTRLAAGALSSGGRSSDSPRATIRATALRSSRTFPGPWLRDEAADEVGRNHLRVAREALAEVPDEQLDVTCTVAKRRELDPSDGEAVKEVVAEFALRDRPIEIAPGRGDDAHVDLDDRAPADTAQLALLDHAQQLGLEWKLEIADLVDQQGPSVRLLEDFQGALRRRP